MLNAFCLIKYKIFVYIIRNYNIYSERKSNYRHGYQLFKEFIIYYYNNTSNFIIINNERRGIMTHLEEIVREIEKIRVLIYQLINENEALTDQKLVVLSQKLDELINEYDKLLN